MNKLQLIYTIIYCSLAAALFSSCEDEAVSKYSNNNISIKTEVAKHTTTKGTPIYNSAEMSDMGLFCYNTKDLQWDNNTNLSPDVMNNLRWNRDENNWKSESPVSWGNDINENDYFSFFGYAPYSKEDNGISVSVDEKGNPYIDYIVPADILKQPDLMVANLTDIHPANEDIMLRYKHALSCIAFKATGSGDVISGVKIKGVSVSGRLDMNHSNGFVWNNLGEPSASYYSAKINDGNNISDSECKKIITNEGYLMMIPQTLQQGAILTVTVNGKDFDFDLTAQKKKEWKAGEIVNYIIDTDKVIPEIITDYTDRELSNCYILNSHPGKKMTYRIPIKRVNEFWDSENNMYSNNNPDFVINDGDEWTVGLLWQDTKGMVEAGSSSETGITVSKASGVGPNDYFSITVPKGFCQNTQGNFVIGIAKGAVAPYLTNADQSRPDSQAKGIINLWSWHFWVTDYNPYAEAEPLQEADDEKGGTWVWKVPGGLMHRYADGNEGNFNDGIVNPWDNETGIYKDKKMLDRTIGEVKVNADDRFGKGILHYQYGNKNPFPAQDALYGYGDELILYTEQANPIWNFCSMNIAVKNPLNIIVSGSQIWLYPDNNAMNTSVIWYDPKVKNGSGGKSIYDPSPLGFNIPQNGTFSGFSKDYTEWDENEELLKYTRRKGDYTYAAVYKNNGNRYHERPAWLNYHSSLLLANRIDDKRNHHSIFLYYANKVIIFERSALSNASSVICIER